MWPSRTAAFASSTRGYFSHHCQVRRGSIGTSARYPPRVQHRIFGTSVASVYPHYVTKVEKKGRTRQELDTVIEWLTGFDDEALRQRLEDGTTFEQFFADAHLNPNASLITGSVCGVKIQEVEDPLMRRIRYLDKLVDELAQGRPLEKILRA